MSKDRKGFEALTDASNPDLADIRSALRGEGEWKRQVPQLARAASTSANVAQGAEAVASIRRIAHELRTYNPAADEYKGEHIHKVWAREIEALLPAASNGEPK